MQFHNIETIAWSGKFMWTNSAGHSLRISCKTEEERVLHFFLLVWNLKALHPSSWLGQSLVEFLLLPAKFDDCRLQESIVGWRIWLLHWGAPCGGVSQFSICVQTCSSAKLWSWAFYRFITEVSLHTYLSSSLKQHHFSVDKKLQQDKKQYIESMWFLIEPCTSESFILQLKLFVVAKGLRVTQGRLSRHKMFNLLCSYVVVLVFHFVTPLQIQVAIYDWEIVWKSQLLGSMSLIINAEEQNGASWHLLDSTGKVRSSFQKSIPIGIFHYFLSVWPCYLIAVFLPFLILQCCSLFLCVEFCNGSLSF